MGSLLRRISEPGFLDSLATKHDQGLCDTSLLLVGIFLTDNFSADTH